MVDRSVVRAKIAFIQVRLHELKARHRKVTAKQFAKDMDVQAIILHHFQTAIQACCDVASHIVADQELGIPSSSAELFEILAKKKIIPWTLARRFGDHVRLRNRIVHGYNKLDFEDIHGTLPNQARSITGFLELIAKYVKL